MAFSANLGYYPITIVRIWGAFYGLHLAWNKGHRMVILEMDSISAIALIIANSVIYHPYGPVIQRVHDFLKRP